MSLVELVGAGRLVKSGNTRDLLSLGHQSETISSSFFFSSVQSWLLLKQSVDLITGRIVLD